MARRCISIMVLVGVAFSLPLRGWTQRPIPHTSMFQDQTGRLADLHKSLFEPRTESISEAGRFTEQASRALPDRVSAAAEAIPRKNFIDEHIFGRIERDRIPHAALAGDEEFIRRVYLDATGLLPEPDAVREFVASREPDKRDRQVDALIGTEEFAEQWAWFWGDLFRITNYSGNGKNAFQYWNKEWLRADRPYDEVVTDLLTPSAKSHNLIPHLAFLSRILRNSGLKNRDLTDPHNYAATVNRLDALDEMAVEIGRIFLGVNFDCISCHDGAGHTESTNLYLSGKTRDDFARQAAFLGQMRLVGIYNVLPSNLILDDLATGYHTGNDAPFHTASENRFPRSGKTYQPAFILTGEEPPPDANPRRELARMIASHPQLARATVNLIWGRLMVVGFVEPWDGFDLARLDPENPPPAPWTIQPTNPELLEALAEDFRAHNYSIHHLMKTIMKSSAYQLSARFPAEWNDSYLPYYARRYVRVMTGPEVVDTIAQVTGRPYRFEFSGIEVQRVKQLTDLNDVLAEAEAGSREAKDVAGIMNSFFQNNREAPVPAGNKMSILQAILMMSLEMVKDRAVAEGDGRLKKLLESDRPAEEVIDELYLATLARWPAPREKEWILETFGFESDRKRAIENLQWALLNQTEFVLNH